MQLYRYIAVALHGAGWHMAGKDPTWRAESPLSLAPHSNNMILHGDSRQAKGHANGLLAEAIHGVGAMKALQTTCIVGLIAFTGIYLASGNRPDATVPDIIPEAAANAVAPALYAEASAKLAIALRAEPGSVTSASPGPLRAAAEITDDPVGPKLASLGHQ